MSVPTCDRAKGDISGRALACASHLLTVEMTCQAGGKFGHVCRSRSSERYQPIVQPAAALDAWCATAVAWHEVTSYQVNQALFGRAASTRRGVPVIE
jgi:hypothetical protein